MNTLSTTMNRLAFIKRTAVAGAGAGLFLNDRLFAGPAEPSAAVGLSPLPVEQSLRLAGQNLLGILNPDDNYLPYWELAVDAEYQAGFQRWWPAHNIGRWLDAMLRLKHTIGFDIPEPTENAMTENAKHFFDNPDHISLSPKGWPAHPHAAEGRLQWDLHSLREGMLALNALARWQQSDWAADMGRKMIQSVDSKLRGDGTWDLEKFDACQKRGRKVIHNTDPCDTHGRMLEALIWFFETTGDPVALRFAGRVAQYHFQNTVTPDGVLPASAKADHTHSYLGTLRGLLLFGRSTRQQEYIDRVAAAYRVNVPRLVKESGYTSHNMVRESFGETTSPGDVAQLALWFAEAGNSEFLDDVDRIVRSRILPSQIRETPPLHPIVNYEKDATRDLEKRILGAYGGCHDHPHGHKLAVTDVTSAGIHTLLDIYQHIVVSDEKTMDVFFHLDCENPIAKVICRRGKMGELTVLPKVERELAIRVPRWTPRQSIRIHVGKDKADPVYAGQFAQLGRVPAGTRITMTYDLPQRQTNETDLGAPYEIFWQGDDVIGVKPNTKLYPFYPDAPAKSAPCGD